MWLMYFIFAIQNFSYTMVFYVFILQHLQKGDSEETDRRAQVHHAEVHEKHPYEKRLTERVLPLDHSVPAKLTGLAKFPQNALIQVSKYY